MSKLLRKNVAEQRMPFGRISSRNASRMSETIMDSLSEILEYSFPILLRLIVLVIQFDKNDSLLLRNARSSIASQNILLFPARI